MNTQCEKIDTNVVKLQVEVSENRVAKALDQAYRKVVKDVAIPGFRKGRVPRAILEAKFGVEVLYEDAIDILLNEAYPVAVEEAEISPVAQPEIVDVNIEKGQPFTFTAHVTVKPEVSLGIYKGIEAEKHVATISDEAVDKALEKLREEHARLEVIDGPAEEGDTVVIDYKGSIDGVAFAGGEAENHALVLGSKSFIPGFEDQLIGTKAEDDVVVKVTFPAEYHSAELAGKDAQFEVKVHEVKRRFVPELDEDFVFEVSEFNSVDELKEDTLNKLKQEAEQLAQNQVRSEILQKVVANAEVEIPEVMIDNEVEQMVNEMSRNMSSYGISLEQYLSMIGQDMEEYKAGLRDEASKRVKTDLVLEELVKTEKIELNEELFEQRLADMAKAYNQTIDDIRKIVEGQPGIKEQLVAGWKKDAAIDFITEQATITIAEEGKTQEEAADEEVTE